MAHKHKVDKSNSLSLISQCLMSLSHTQQEMLLYFVLANVMVFHDRKGLFDWMDVFLCTVTLYFYTLFIPYLPFSLTREIHDQLSIVILPCADTLALVLEKTLDRLHNFYL